MKKVSNRLLGLLFVLLFVGTANAATYTYNWKAISTPDGVSRYELDPMTIDLNGEEFLRAEWTVSYGNSDGDNTTPFMVLLDKPGSSSRVDTLGHTYGSGHSGYNYKYNWSPGTYTGYTFVTSESAFYGTGEVNPYMYQMYDWATGTTSTAPMRVGGINLKITTAEAAPVPIPPAIALFGFGLASLVGVKRRSKI
jgi:hypothetical protein